MRAEIWDLGGCHRMVAESSFGKTLFLLLQQDRNRFIGGLQALYIVSEPRVLEKMSIY